MKAWRLNEYDWYAADTFDEAVNVAMEQTGESREDVIDDMFVTGEPEPDSTEVWADEQRTYKLSVATILSQMDGPGFAFGIES